MSAQQVGIFELSERDQAKTVDVVAIHGILGGPFKTWKHENGKMWLKDFLAKELPFARIMTFGYDAAVAFSKGVGNIESNARYLLNQLSAERAASGSQRSDGRPIVFICHSLGGIIVKKAMVIAHERSSELAFKDILDNTKAMAFLSVPHRGSDAAWWGDLGANILKSASMGIWTNRELIKDLKKQSPALMDISKQFVPRSQAITIYAFYERSKTDGLLVVDEDSATMGIANERLFPVYADHHTICKFESAESQAYKSVGRHVVSLVGSVAPAALPLTKEQADCIRSLYLSDPDAMKDRVPPRTDGTCEWLLDDPSYRDWLKPEGSPLLWVTGAPGMGKTVLASFIIDQMRLYQPRIATCFFFWDDKYALQKNAVALLRGILYQIFHHRQNLSIHALNSWIDTAGKAFEEASVLWRICTACFDDPSLGELVCILDALDECQPSERSQLMKWITQYFKKRPPNTNRVKLILTSRPEITMSDILDDSASRIKLEIRTDKDWLSIDIENFIDHEIKTLPALRNLPEARRRQLRDRLVQNADRNFLWVSLVLEKIPLEVELSEDEFVTMLSRIPDRLEQLYRDILMSIPRENRDKAKKMLSILTMAQNPLSQEELQECWAIERHHVSVRHMVSNRVPDIRRTVALLCGQFVRWEKPKQNIRGETNKDNNSEECRLVHQSAKEFLLMNTNHNPMPSTGKSWYALNVAEAASLMASKCVWFATLQEFGDIVINPIPTGQNLQAIHEDIDEDILKPWELKSDLQRSCKKYPFLRYTLRYWARHYRDVEMLEASIGSGLQSLIKTVTYLYRKNKSFRAYWFMRMLRLTDTSLSYRRCRVPAVVFCAYNGHRTILPCLVKGAEDLNASIVQLNFTALHMAVLGKHLPLVEWLLNKKADIEAVDGWERTPLHLAARRNNVDVLQCLLDHKANIFRKDMYGLTPIRGAWDRQLTNHVDLLLKHERSLTGAQLPSPSQNQLFDLPLNNRLSHDHDSTVRYQWATELPLESICEYYDLNFPWEDRSESESSSESSDERRSLSLSTNTRSSTRNQPRKRVPAQLRKSSSYDTCESTNPSNDLNTEVPLTPAEAVESYWGFLHRRSSFSQLERKSSPFARSSASIEPFKERKRSQSEPDVHRYVMRGRRARLNEDRRKLKRKRPSVTFTDASEEHDSACRGGDESPSSPWAKKAVLAIDGGGVRSYSSILILRELMKTIVEREKSYLDGLWPANSSWHPLVPPSDLPNDTTNSTELLSWLPCHYFDFVGGTSSGGLISIMLGRLRMNIVDAIAEFENVFANILEEYPQSDKRWPQFWAKDNYRHEISIDAYLEGLVLRRLPKYPRGTTSAGDVSFKDDEAQCRTVIIGCRRRSHSEHPEHCFFRSYDLPSQEGYLSELLPLIPARLTIWEVARCALSMPRYLKPVHIEGWEYVDGSLVAHNPIELLHQEVATTSHHAPRCCRIIVSLGSGKCKKRSGLKGSLLNLNQSLKLVRASAADAEETHLSFRRDIGECLYFRFDVEDGLETIEGDEWRVERSKRGKLLQPSRMKQKPRNKTLETIAKHTLAYISTKEVQERISQCAEILVEARRSRASSDPIRWERTCYGS